MDRTKMRFLVCFLLFSVGFVSLSPAATYVTEAQVQIDRCACVWLIRRFVDAKSEFVFFESGKTPPEGIGFDYFGAKYFHRGRDCSYTTMVKEFGFPANKALVTLDEVVNDTSAWMRGPKTLSAFAQNYIGGLHDNGLSDTEILSKTDAMFDLIYFRFGGDASLMLATSQEQYRDNLQRFFGSAPVSDAEGPPPELQLGEGYSEAEKQFFAAIMEKTREK